jgi:hypothetical protein
MHARLCPPYRLVIPGRERTGSMDSGSPLRGVRNDNGDFYPSALGCQRGA